VNSPSSPDDASTAFHDYAEAQAAATVRTLITQAAKPALTELEALRVAIDVRCESLAATLAGAATTDPAPIRQLVDRLAHAAGEEAGAAARAARTLALEEAEARLQLDRLEAQKQLDAVRAERDAQLDALNREREQAEAARADRDAQLAALRAAQEQADALRAERDAQLAALWAAQQQADALRADRDAQLAALSAAAQQVAAIGAERDVHQRTAESATSEAQRVQGEQDALLEAARISNARHTRLLEQAQARAEAAQTEAAVARAQAAEAQAHFAAAQAHLAAVQEELAVAQAEAERRLALGASEIEALRLELERVRASMQAAREARVEPEQPFVAMAPQPVAVSDVIAEPLVEPEPAAFAAFESAAMTAIEPMVEPMRAVAPVFETPIEAASQPAIEFVSEPAVEPVSEPVIAAVAQPAPEWQALHLVEHTSQAEPPVAIATIVEPEPIREAAEADPVRAIHRAIDGAADLSQVLDALVDGAGVLFPRAALFVVKTKSKRLQGWRSVGFTGVAAITREFEFPLTTDSALTRAVTASRTIVTGEGQSAQSAEAWTVTFPVTTGGRVVAVVHADDGVRSGDPAAAFDRDTALDLGHTLVRMAGDRIGALTMSARAAFGSVMNVAPADTTPAVVAPVTSAPASVTPIDINGAGLNGTHVNGSLAAPPVAVVPETAAAAVPASPDAAVLVASQLVSEINRYNQAAAGAPADERLQERLAGQIEGARTQAVAPAAPAASALGLFDEALGKMLGNGALDQAPEAIQTF
jgi:hypothetical protein